ncbi:MAG: formylglycine-generating enzyme family protein [Pseudomonadota bacterium]|nr:formylglycine-generating enzyme family protein [Pseudomonadota bacterium]
MQAARLTWVAIPAGSFEMGCSSGDMECNDDESPRHTVAVEAFELTQTEITQQQYLEITGRISNGHPDCPDCPADEVLWGDARGFCEDVGGRLPSEAEWEYAARAGSIAAWPCSPEPACLAEIAWYEGNSGGESHPVATRAVSSLGLYDMQGNAWEWLEDCLHGEPVDANYMGAPSTGEAWVDGSNANCEMRMLRGGAYFSTEERFRVSYRYYDWVLGVSGRGFRCAR